MRLLKDNYFYGSGYGRGSGSCQAVDFEMLCSAAQLAMPNWLHSVLTACYTMFLLGTSALGLTLTSQLFDNMLLLNTKNSSSTYPTTAAPSPSSVLPKVATIGIDAVSDGRDANGQVRLFEVTDGLIFVLVASLLMYLC